MAGKTHPYLQAIYISSLIFVAVIFFVVFIALYVHSAVTSQPAVPTPVVEKNLTAPGKIYPRQ